MAERLAVKVRAATTKLPNRAVSLTFVMWTYKQSTGELFTSGDGSVVGVGYSGAPGFKNDPSDESLKMKGPIPEGFYTIEEPRDTQSHGPFAMPLTPDPENEMFGRSSFLMHGDSIEHPGAASEGCIIMARAIRQQVWDSGDHRLQVIP